MKKLNKKGFTLIELLAVIVVLAIIIVIAVPSVLNIQKNAKMGTAKDEALLLIKSIDLCMASEQDSSKCGPEDLGNYYEKSANGVSTGYSKGAGNYTYTFDTTTAESYTLKGFKFASNGYEVVAADENASYTTQQLKTMIQDETDSISIK